MDLVSSIEARLRACASTGTPVLTKSELSILSEWRVACHRVRHFSERLLAHRREFARVEIDLLLSSANELSLIEVKTVSGDLWAFQPLARAQKLRLMRARDHIEAQARRPVALSLAVVERGVGEIAFYEF